MSATPVQTKLPLGRRVVVLVVVAAALAVLIGTATGDRGYLAMVSTGPGHAEQVRELPLDADLVIMRLPIAGG